MTLNAPGLSGAHRTAGHGDPWPLSPLEIAWGVRRGGCPPARACRGSVAARHLLHLEPRRGLRSLWSCPAWDSLSRTLPVLAAPMQRFLEGPRRFCGACYLDSKVDPPVSPAAPGPELVPRSPPAWRAQESLGAALCPGRGGGGGGGCGGGA